MAVHTLCLAPHPVLRASARPIDVFSEELQRLAQDLIETMHAHDGIGLAAPQIGCDLQVVVANPSQARGQDLVVVNPVLEAGEGRAAMVEGCLSLPNLWERVRRFARVRVSGRDVSGQPVRLEAQGLLAIVLQHEVDHLQGRFFVDRLPWWRRSRPHTNRRSRAEEGPIGVGACA